MENPEGRNARPRLLVLHGDGAAGPHRYGPSLSPLGDIVSVYCRDALEVPDDEVPVMAEVGAVLEAPTVDDIVATALELAADAPFDAVLTFSEPLLDLAAELAERLGLRHHSREAVATIRDKGLQRAALARGGVPVPASTTISGPAEIPAALEAVPLPAVLKPAFGMGSAYTYRIDTVSDLHAALDRSLEAYSSDVRMSRQDARFVLEEMLIGGDWHGEDRMGDYVSVESLVAGDDILHLTITDKLPLQPGFRELGDVMPSRLGPEQQREVLDMATRAIRACGATLGATHTEIKLTPQGPRIIEVNGRLGGGVAPLLAESAGFDMVRAIGELALTGDLPEPPVFQRWAGWLNPHSPQGDVRVSAFGGQDEVAALDGVVLFAPFVDVGEVPNWRAGLDWVYGLLARADSHAGVTAVFDSATAVIDLEFEPLEEPAATAG